jgi:hypothetical protein
MRIIKAIINMKIRNEPPCKTVFSVSPWLIIVYNIDTKITEGHGEIIIQYNCKL